MLMTQLKTSIACLFILYNNGLLTNNTDEYNNANYTLMLTKNSKERGKADRTKRSCQCPSSEQRPMILYFLKKSGIKTCTDVYLTKNMTKDLQTILISGRTKRTLVMTGTVVSAVCFFALDFLFLAICGALLLFKPVLCHR